MTQADPLDRMMAVMEAAFDPKWGEAWNRRQLADALCFSNTHHLLIDAGGRFDTDHDPAGFLLSRGTQGEEELLLVAVDPQHRRCGIGTHLLRRFIDDARSRGAERIFLEMRENNPAQELYRREGFEPIGLRPNYYRLSDGSAINAITFGRSV